MRETLVLDKAFQQGLSRVAGYRGTDFLYGAENSILDNGLKPWTFSEDAEFIEAGISECVLFKDGVDVYLAGDVSGEGRGLYLVGGGSPVEYTQCRFLNPSTLIRKNFELTSDSGWELETMSPEGDVLDMLSTGSSPEIYTLGTVDKDRLFAIGVYAEIEEGQFRITLYDGSITRNGPWIYSNGWHYFILDSVDMALPVLQVDFTADGFSGKFGNTEGGFGYEQSDSFTTSLPDGSIQFGRVFDKACLGTSDFISIKYRDDLFFIDDKNGGTICGLRGRLYSTASYVGPEDLSVPFEQELLTFRWDTEKGSPYAEERRRMVRWSGVGLQDFIHEMSTSLWFGQAVTGESYLDTVERNEFGYAPLTSSSEDEILYLHDIGDKVVAYCTDGIYFLTPILDPHSTIAIQKVSDIGIKDRAHVACASWGHIFIRSDNRICSLSPDGGLEVLAEGSILPSYGVAYGSYLPYENGLFFTDGIEETLLYRGGGFTTISQVLYSSVQVNNRILYTCRDKESAYFLVRTSRLNMGFKRYKTIFGVELGFRGSELPFTTLVITAYAGGEIIGVVSEDIDRNGYCPISATGVEFTIEMVDTYNSEEPQDFALEYLKIEFSADERHAGRPLS